MITGLIISESIYNEHCLWCELNGSAKSKWSCCGSWAEPSLNLASPVVGCGWEVSSDDWGSEGSGVQGLQLFLWSLQNQDLFSCCNWPKTERRQKVWAVYLFIHSFVHSFQHSTLYSLILTYSRLFTPWFTLSFTHAFTHSITRSSGHPDYFIHLLTHSHIHLLTRLLVHMVTLTHSFIHLPLRLLIRSFINSLFRSFIHSLCH